MDVNVTFRGLDRQICVTYKCTHVTLKDGIMRLEKREFGYTEHVVSIPIDTIAYWVEED